MYKNMKIFTTKQNNKDFTKKNKKTKNQILHTKNIEVLNSRC